MRLIQGQLQAPPRSCAIIPNRSTDPNGFIDTNRVLPGWDQHVYVSVTAVKEMGRMVGMVSPAEVEKHLTRIAEIEDELSELTMKLDALEQIKELEEVVI